MAKAVVSSGLFHLLEMASQMQTERTVSLGSFLLSCLIAPNHFDYQLGLPGNAACTTCGGDGTCKQLVCMKVGGNQTQQ